MEEKIKNAGVMGLVAGLVGILGFFLPTVEACGSSYSAFEIAQRGDGGPYLVLLIFGVSVISSVAVLATRGRGGLVGQGIAGALGVLIILGCFLDAKSEDDFGILKPLIGFYLMLFSFLFLSVHSWFALSYFSESETASNPTSKGKENEIR